MARGPTLRRALRRIALAVVILLLAAYALLLTWHLYSAWRASRILTRVESIQLGAPASAFYSAVHGLRCENERHGMWCATVPGMYHTSLFSRLAHRAPDLSQFLARNLNHIGLRYWQLTAGATISNGSIERLDAGIIVVGRDETLGADVAACAHLTEVANPVHRRHAENREPWLV
jgi:hypothetical protein